MQNNHGGNDESKSVSDILYNGDVSASRFTDPQTLLFAVIVLLLLVFAISFSFHLLANKSITLNEYIVI